MKEAKINRICKYVCLLSFGFFICTLVFQMYTSNNTALKGKDFLELYSKKEQLEKEITYLKFEESSMSSLSYVEKKAQELGFTPMKEPLNSIVYPSLASLSTAQ